MDSNVLDLNLVVLCGRLATDPEIRVFDSGSRLVRLLVTVRAQAPRRRTDVIPVTYWDPSDDFVEELPGRAHRVWVCGAVQRRYWESPDGRRSRIEVVAEAINFKDVLDLEPVSTPS